MNQQFENKQMAKEYKSHYQGGWDHLHPTESDFHFKAAKNNMFSNYRKCKLVTNSLWKFGLKTELVEKKDVHFSYQLLLPIVDPLKYKVNKDPQHVIGTALMLAVSQI